MLNWLIASKKMAEKFPRAAYLLNVIHDALLVEKFNI